MNLKATNTNDVFPCPCSCYETKMAQGREVARSHCWDNPSNWSDTPCSENIRGAASSHSRVNACNWSEAPCGEGMNLLIGHLSFPQALGRDGPWPPVGSQDGCMLWCLGI